MMQTACEMWNLITLLPLMMTMLMKMMARGNTTSNLLPLYKVLDLLTDKFFLT